MVITIVKLSEEMKTAFSKVKIFPVATASNDGIPNVVPIGFCQLVDDETIWIVDNFMVKSLVNLEENPNVAVYVWGPETGGCFQIKGEAEIISSGEKFDKMKGIVHAAKPGLPAKNLIEVKISEVFQCAPGPGAGKKLL
ncbi:pyridoxamine 5'-phosphate oxidase, FMN-binding family [Methanosarcina horonobensis HB-1 = JCM 15518]|uniref:Pyridoxamine 5'-phosphate oxidase, FMN-binding family n=1 Tax=Methanosarcina horonobensis HB-1 = JCM 15518 TaxID=1434110 RepID=A0A0E3SGS0_9EURY|nr:pyridoxamine 5'-phosphate oxidase, FMN-binding family [Methanosarcina horonobensis HB-1 = JCM 15518]